MLNRINNFFYDYIFGTLTPENISSKISEISTNLQRLQEVLKENSDFQFLDTVIRILETKHDDMDSVIDLYEFFKNPIRFHVKYKENLTISARQLVQALPEMADLFPEIEIPVRPNILDLCDKLEERETVIGSAFSELTLRLAGGFPIRYIYQDAHSSLYEYLEVVCKVIGQTAIGKTFKTSEELSGYVGSYINSPSNDLYFNSRFFVQQVEHKLLPEAVFKDFGLTYVPPKLQPLIAPVIEQQQKAKPRKILSSAKVLIENTVGSFFEEKDIPNTLTYLTTDGKTIKRDFSLILQGRFEEVEHIVSEVEGYLESVTDDQYDPSKIAPILDLLKIIKERNFE